MNNGLPPDGGVIYLFKWILAAIASLILAGVMVGVAVHEVAELWERFA